MFAISVDNGLPTATFGSASLYSATTGAFLRVVDEERPGVIDRNALDRALGLDRAEFRPRRAELVEHGVSSDGFAFGVFRAGHVDIADRGVFGFAAGVPAGRAVIDGDLRGGGDGELRERFLARDFSARELRFELLDPAVAAVGDVDVTGRVDSDRGGMGELARAGTRAAEVEAEDVFARSGGHRRGARAQRRREGQAERGEQARATR